ncbi:MAG: YfcE family phosphodiesterase [Anaerolineales bacterium]|nr:YfcE family phosphodiesterase [Anaerolineales bacterium]
MRVAVLSDTHDNIWRLEEALPHLRSSDVVIHCGDLCSPFMIRHLGQGLPGKPVHLVWGNNDGDTYLISKVAAGFADIHLHGPLAQLELEGVKVAVNHYPELARGLASTQTFGLVCYGHDHTAHFEWVGGCLLLNPGELMGLDGRSSLALVDLPDREVQFLDLRA